MGQFMEGFRTSPGAPLRRWVAEVPNDGLIRYLDIFNMERVAVVKPEALADVLVHQCYSFEKPAPLRKGISRILGMGLFLAEGQVHQVGLDFASAVSRMNIMLITQVTTEATLARIRFPAPERSVSDFLGKIRGARRSCIT